MSFSYQFYKWPVPIWRHKYASNLVVPFVIFNLPILLQSGFESINSILLPVIMTYCVCRNPSLGLTTKSKGLQGCEPKGSSRVKARRRSPGVTSQTPGSVRKCEGVWGNEPSHSQGNSHFGRWSPGGLPKLQRAIAGVKTQWLVAFFISLESSWNVDV
jgi:hypothetical protein